MWSVDWDQANQFAWDRQFTLITASALVDFTVTVNDDGTVVVNDLDQTQANDWASKVIVYSASGDMQSETVTYDDGHIAILHPGDPGFADAAQADPLGFYTSAFPDYDNPTLTSDAGISYFVDDDTGRLVTMGGPGDDVSTAPRPRTRSTAAAAAIRSLADPATTVRSRNADVRSSRTGTKDRIRFTQASTTPCRTTWKISFWSAAP